MPPPHPAKEKKRDNRCIMSEHCREKPANGWEGAQAQPKLSQSTYTSSGKVFSRRKWPVGARRRRKPGLWAKKGGDWEAGMEVDW